MIRLRWRVAAAYFALIAAILLLLGLVITDRLEQYYLQALRADLEEQARLASRALLLGDVFAGSLEAEVDRIGAGLTARLTVVAPDGTVLGDSWEDGRRMENHRWRPEINAALRGQVGADQRESATTGIGMVYVAVPLIQDGQTVAVVRMAESQERISALLGQIRRSIGAALLLTGLLSLISATLLSGRLTRTVEELTTWARRLAGGDLRAGPVPAAGHELGVLAGALETMAGNLREQFRQVEESRSRLETVLENMRSAVFFIDRGGRLILANPTARDWFQLSNYDLGASHFATLRSSGLNAMIDQVLKEGQPLHREIELFGPLARELEADCVPIFKRGQEAAGAVVVLHDITLASQLARLRADFVANVSHQFKTPVAAIKGYAETLLSGEVNDPAVVSEFLGTLEREATRLSHLVDDLLKLSSLETANEAVSPSAIELPVFGREVADQWQGKASAREVTLSVSDEPLAIWADRRWLREALDNLFENSLRYTPSGGRVSLSWAVDRHHAVIRVSDTGPGVPAAHRERIFERFYRYNSAGTGLGLAIVKHVAELHGGRAEARNLPEGGFVIDIVLPRSRVLNPESEA